MTDVKVDKGVLEAALTASTTALQLTSLALQALMAQGPDYKQLAEEVAKLAASVAATQEGAGRRIAETMQRLSRTARETARTGEGT